MCIQVARETVPSSVVEIWHITARSLSIPPLSDNEDHEDITLGPVQLAAKRKSAASRIIKDSDDDAEDASFSNILPSSSNKGKKRAREIESPEVSFSNKSTFYQSIHLAI